MTKPIGLLALLALVLWLSDVAAKDYWGVQGEGRGSCGNWTKAQRHRPQIGADGLMPVTFADMDLATQAAWVQGFISAFNYYGGATAPDIASGTDANGVFAWIDNYCAAHPLDSIATATIALLTELSQRGQ
jgi:hypothetical protein